MTGALDSRIESNQFRCWSLLAWSQAWRYYEFHAVVSPGVFHSLWSMVESISNLYAFSCLDSRVWALNMERNHERGWCWTHRRSNWKGRKSESLYQQKWLDLQSMRYLQAPLKRPGVVPFVREWYWCFIGALASGFQETGPWFTSQVGLNHEFRLIGRRNRLLVVYYSRHLERKTAQ